MIFLIKQQKTKEMKHIYNIIIIALFTFFALSCNDTNEPMALFDYQIDGVTVQFTNYSTDSQSYIWDFGDGNTSTEENPLHEYAESGSFIITLTATGDGGSKTIKSMIKIQRPSIIEIDGNFDDWNNVPLDELFSTSTTNDDSALKSLKVHIDSDYIYLYLEYEESKIGPIDILLNTDNDNTTGGESWMWSPSGTDYLIEGFLESKMEDSSVFYWPEDAPQDGWEWIETLGPGSGVVKMSNSQDIGNGISAAEMSIIREMITDSFADEIEIGIFSSDEDWSENGNLPNTSDGTSAPLLRVIIK